MLVRQLRLEVRPLELIYKRKEVKGWLLTNWLKVRVSPTLAVALALTLTR